MIDEEWLGALNFEGINGCRIVGLAGVGADKITLNAVLPDGRKIVIQTYRHVLGYHIREIPLLLSGTSRYDVPRLNRKIANLIGREDLDEMTSEYDRLCSSVMRALYTSYKNGLRDSNAIEAAMPALGRSIVPSCPEAWQFILVSPFIKRRFGEIASMREPARGDFAGLFPTVNGPNFPISTDRSDLVQWSRTMLKVIAKLEKSAPLEPSSSAHNPAFVWGAAVTDSFFTDKELPLAVNFIKEKFGSFPSNPRAAVWIDQMHAVSSLLVCMLKESEVGRLTKFCGMLGLLFDVHDRGGKVVASSMQSLFRAPSSKARGDDAVPRASHPSSGGGSFIGRLLKGFFSN